MEAGTCRLVSMPRQLRSVTSLHMLKFRNANDVITVPAEHTKHGQRAAPQARLAVTATPKNPGVHQDDRLFGGSHHKRRPEQISLCCTRYRYRYMYIYMYTHTVYTYMSLCLSDRYRVPSTNVAEGLDSLSVSHLLASKLHVPIV